MISKRYDVLALGIAGQSERIDVMDGGTLVAQADAGEFRANLKTIHGRLALRTFAASLDSIGEYEAAAALLEIAGRQG